MGIASKIYEEKENWLEGYRNGCVELNGYKDGCVDGYVDGSKSCGKGTTRLFTALAKALVEEHLTG